MNSATQLGTGRPTRIVILGGGFAGVHTARRLSEKVRGRADVEVELLSEENYFVFQPLLPEVAAGGIAANHVVNPIRELIPRVRFRCCQVVEIDFERKVVLVSQGEGLEFVAVPYDHLVFALGRVSNFASMPGVAEHGLGMKDLSDAFRLRNHVISCLEQADIEADPSAKAALLTFVVAGGGFSGVETLGELGELVSRSLRYFPAIDPEQVRLVLVHGQARILPEMAERLAKVAEGVLKKRGVELLLDTRVRSASPHAVHLSGDRVIPCRTFVCTVGTATNPLVLSALEVGGFQRAELRGRRVDAFATEPTLRCLNKPGYWAVGDCAGIPSPSGEGLCPPTAQFAMREGKRCADNILLSLQSRPLRPFSFQALGSLASLGQRNAVAQLFGVQLTGFVAWFVWRTVYLMKLPGFARRLRVALDWTLDLFFPRDITQLQVFKHEHLHVHHYETGETIVQQGQIGRELYIVLRGEVVVSTELGDPIATLGPRDVFGERALLEDTRRNATVRAGQPSDVLVLSRGDFAAMVRSMPVLEDYFTVLLGQRQEPKHHAPPGSDRASGWLSEARTTEAQLHAGRG